MFSASSISSIASLRFKDIVIHFLQVAHHQRLTLSLKCSSLEDLYGIKQLTVVPD